jgi:ABC-type antimicrobial peptide transport system permease subunit
VMLSLAGGVLGVFLGIGASIVVGRTLGWPMQLSLSGIVLAALFSTGVGVVFGYYPARKASLLDPIDAVRYE